MTDRLGTFVKNNPVGTKWSYSFRINGLPYNWTDGRAVWNDAVHTTEVSGALAENAFKFDLNFSPLSPLDVGNGLKFKLLDNNVGLLRKLFAPNYGIGTRLTATVGNAATDLTLTVMDSSVFTVGEMLYIGASETMEVGVLPTATTITVTRAKFHSLRRVHNPYNSETGPLVTNSPRVFKNRYVELWAGPVNPVTGVLEDSYMIWAGVVNAINNDGLSFTVDCGSLTTPIAASWPATLAKGKLAISDGITSIPSVYLRGQDYVFKVYKKYSGTTTVSSHALGRLIAGTWTAYVQTGKQFTAFELLESYISSLIHYFPANATTAILRCYQLYEASESEDLRIDNLGATDFRIDTSFGLGRVFASMGANPLIVSNATAFMAGFGQLWLKASTQGPLRVTSGSTSIGVVLEDKALPFDENQGYIGRGFAKVTGNSQFEIVEFDGTVTSSDNARLQTLTISRRGALGTKPITFVGEEGGESGFEVEQLASFGDFGTNGHPATIILLHALLSTGDFNQNSVYDSFGERLSIGMPLRYVDLASFEALHDIDMLPIHQFWVEKAGEGKKAIEELMRAAGLVFVTRRFERGGESLFGLAAASISMPTLSAYSETLSDSDRLAKTKAVVDYNERLIVNLVKLNTTLSQGGDNANGRTVHVPYEDSIADYGVVETLELKPQALLGTSRSRGAMGYTPASRDELNAAEANFIAQRWFAAYAQGNYTLTVEMPFVGWRYQAADVLAVTLTGVGGADGGANLSNVISKVIKLTCSFGDKPSCIAKMRLAYSDRYELVPSAEITAQATSGSVLTLADNVFSEAGDLPPFGLTSPCKDVMWFDRTKADANIPVYIYKEGDESVSGHYAISATDLALGKVTLAAGISAGLQTAVGGARRVIMVYDVYTASSAVLPTGLYAYIGDNNTPSSTGKIYV